MAEWFQRCYRSVRGYFTSRPKKTSGPQFIEVPRADQCIFCKGWHARYCGRVQRISFNDKGDPREVAYWGDSEWDQTKVMFLDTDRFEGDWVFISVKEQPD